jgi:hypothetical protein
VIAVNRGTGLFMLASVLALGASWRPMRTEPRFLVTNDKPSEATPRFESRIAWRPEGVKEVHGSTLAALPGGELLMVYYGGSTESALDVKL